MAASCLRSSKFFCQRLLTHENVAVLKFQQCKEVVPVSSCQLTIVRGSFFTRHPVDDLWKSVTSVSSQGRRRGRASRGKLMRREDFSKGPQGVGSAGMVFPGLTKNIDVRDSRSQKMYQTSFKPQETDTKKKPRRRLPDHVLDLGYSGSRLDGRKKGPPPPLDDYNFEGFQSVVLKTKLVGTVTAAKGTIMRPHVLVAVGNGKGLVGIASARGSGMIATLDTAKKKAAQRLMYVDVFENHTIYHNFVEKSVNSRVIAYSMHRGHGLVCHRVLQTLCELIGIKDIYVKTEGNRKNYLAITRAFINGLLKQKSFQDFAEETGHHVVQYRVEQDDFPRLLASPSKHANKDFKKDHSFDFENYCLDNNLLLHKEKKRKLPKKKAERVRRQIEYQNRNQQNCKMERMMLGLENSYKAT